MRLEQVSLANFRSYRDKTRIDIGNLTAFIGRNDAGKSTVLEALDVVFGHGKIEIDDANVAAGAGECVEIECSFEDAFDEISLDSGSKTTLRDENLLDDDGRLRIRWSWPISASGEARSLGKQRVHLVAYHPTNVGVDDLHTKTNSALKASVRDAGIESQCDLTNNASMRLGLWEAVDATVGLDYAATQVEVAKADGKTIWTQVQRLLPMYTLFKSDRPSTDQDSEVQDPMRVAVREAIEEAREELDEIAERVKSRALEVAERTIASLHKIDEALANQLTPTFVKDPAWDGLFKFSLHDDAGIPLNKRGSGARRLVLISFFRAEAEVRRTREAHKHVIYAIEEPETAQHPRNQRRIVAALRELALQDGCQVLLTTHVPGLAELIPVESIRLVSQKSGEGRVASARDNPDDDIAREAAMSLGVLPGRPIDVLVCVEGPTDVLLLKRFAELLRTVDPSLIDLAGSQRVAVIPLGGSTLGEWVQREYLRHAAVHEFHIYDRDTDADGVPKYQAQIDAVNARQGSHSGRSTDKREIENYLHPAAIRRVLSDATGVDVDVTFGDYDDVKAVVATALADQNGRPRARIGRRDLKQWFAHEVASSMTLEELQERDAAGEIQGWMKQVGTLVSSE